MASDLEFIRECVGERRIIWTYHSSMRMINRSIDRSDVLRASEDFEVIEQYPAENRLPSCLCLGRDGRGRSFHCVVALDRLDRSVRFVTVYYPDPEQWEPGFMKRRKA